MINKLQKKTVIIGPSGGGKSTLLKGLYKKFFNQTDNLMPCCLMPQKNYLFDLWTVIENLMNPLRIVKKTPKKEAYDRSLSLLKKFNLDQKEKELIHNLSGGETQRICLIRTILFEYEWVLLDEPTSALDVTSKKMIEMILKEINFIMVSHDLDLARNVGEYFIFIKNGLIVEEGPYILNNPITLDLKSFLNQ